MSITPQNSYPKLAQALGIPEIILKREDLHPYGSHKGRSIPYMIEEYIKQGYSDFVISSSGNAALAAIYTAKEKDINLKVFVGKNIDKEKLRHLERSIAESKDPLQFQEISLRQLANRDDKKISIEKVENPKQSAFQLEKITPHHKGAGLKNLRQSTDDLAMDGYKTLVKELEKIDNLEAIFIPTSSGTTAQALGIFLNDTHPTSLPPSPNAMEGQGKLRGTQQIHIVQTTACHPIAEVFDKVPPLSKGGSGGVLAGAIVDKIAHRKEKLTEIIKNSQGFGWIVTDEEIQEAIKLVKETTDIDISPNSALSIAGLQKAIKENWKWDGPVVCLITGK